MYDRQGRKGTRDLVQSDHRKDLHSRKTQNTGRADRNVQIDHEERGACIKPQARLNK